ncbi:putative proline dehydrogenase 2, partial [Armadillidium nasatum]
LINYLIPIIAKSNGKCQVIAATHNEESVTNATQQMALRNIPKFNPNFQFAQIYGMADNITIPLSKAGFSVYKSVPYGNVNEVIPYLSRRANENRAVFRGARRERALLSQELLRRIRG